jgi:L-ascorbate metabolism protein UlaG (beta-lactamase superfamily)
MPFSGDWADARAKPETPDWGRETMELSWLGHSCFRLKGKEATLITDPPSPSTGYSLGRVNADIVTISHDHTGHNYVEGVAGEPRVVSGPGEYEIEQVLITGVQTYHDLEHGKVRGRNTAYLITMDDIHICHLGDLGDRLDEKALEALSNADVLLVPVGGRYTLDAARAAEVIAQLEPRVIVPMHYQTPTYKAAGEPLDPVEKFLQEMGVEAAEPVAKLAITPTSLPAEPQVVLLSYRGG